MEISAKAVMDLRAKTGVSMMACKRALIEAGGDEEKAIDLLRKSGEAKAVSKADRETTEGVVFAEIRGNIGVVVKVVCETDFVARTESFVKLVKDIANIAFEKNAEAAMTEGEAIANEAIVTLGENIKVADVSMLKGDNLAVYVHSNNKVAAIVSLEGGDGELGKNMAMQVVASAPSVVNPDEVDASEIEKEKDVYRDQLKAEGKPENIIENIIEGKVRKFKESQALITQDYIRDPAMKVKDVLGGAKVLSFVMLKIG